jgi:CHASE2 domain-containing sensor protein
MKIFIIFNITSGDFTQGFSLTLECREIALNQSQVIGQKRVGILPQNSTIVTAYKNWYKCYYRCIYPMNIKGINDLDFYEFEEEKQAQDETGIEIYQIQQTSSFTYEEILEKYAENLKIKMSNWLKTSEPEYNKIRETFIAITNKYKSAEIIPIITVEDSINPEIKDILYQLPWHEWDILKPPHKTRIEIGINYNNHVYNIKNITAKSHHKVRILPIFGDNTNLELQKQEEKNLEKLSKIAQIKKPLKKPTQQELVEKLRDRTGFDILIYSGHSQGETLGIRDLKGSKLEEFENALKFAVENGTKIAILNSCDSLKIAQKLLNYGIAVVIAMKIEVPEEVALQFLDEFLTQYAIKNQSLYQSVQIARDSLESLEKKYPGAMFFPVICQNLALEPLHCKQITETRRRTNFILASVLTSIVLTLGIRDLGLLERFELKTYDLFLSSRPEITKENDRLLVVTIAEEDLKLLKNKSQKEAIVSDNILADDMVAQIIETTQKYQPKMIGLDIFRDKQFGSNRQKLAKQLTNYNNLFIICQTQQNRGLSIAPPKEISLDFVGFSDFLIDHDQVVRRQLIYQDIIPDSTCQADHSLSFRLALKYLAKKNIIPPPELPLKLGKIIFNQLENKSAGYNNLGNNEGYQLLINYADRNQIKEIYLNDLLNNPNVASLIENKIVLIGYADKRDIFSTPYGDTIPGVVIHGQMVNQILSAVLDNRPLIWMFSWWGDAIFIITSVGIGGIILIYCKDFLTQATVIIIAAIIVSVNCYLALWLIGLWLPVIPSVLGLLLLLLGSLRMAKLSKQAKNSQEN